MTSFAALYEKFAPEIAQELAGLIQQAYDQFDNPQEWYLREPHEFKGNLLGERIQFAWLKRQDVPFGFIASKKNSNNVYVVFRGTKNFIEWFKDAQIKLQPYNQIIGSTDDSGSVAEGFKDIYCTLRTELIKTLNQCPQDSQIYVTGHSLGGALATLAIPDIIKNTQFKDSQIELYTFASPRCGNREFASYFLNTGVRHWRIANTEDMVTMLPFPTGNVFSADKPETPPEKDCKINPADKSIEDLGVGGVDRNPNPLFGFFKAMYDRNKRRMPDYAHTGTPVYFTINEAALERHHNLYEVYIKGISVDKLSLS